MKFVVYDNMTVFLFTVKLYWEMKVWHQSFYDGFTIQVYLKLNITHYVTRVVSNSFNTKLSMWDSTEKNLNVFRWALGHTDSGWLSPDNKDRSVIIMYLIPVLQYTCNSASNDAWYVLFRYYGPDCHIKMPSYQHRKSYDLTASVGFSILVRRYLYF